jgi:hypothetical protein
MKIQLLFVLLLTTAVLVACSETDSAPTDTVNQEEQTTEPAARDIQTADDDFAALDEAAEALE